VKYKQITGQVEKNFGVNTYGLVVDFSGNIWHARYTGGFK
jgi:hypothetical protein